MKIGENGRPVLNKHQKPETELLIETRAEGHYVVTFPSPPRCHPEGKDYYPVAGDWCDLPTLTAQEHSVLISICASFNEYVEPVFVHTESTKPANGTGTRPGDDFNIRATWEEVLEPQGWQPVKVRGDGLLWRKPDARKNPYHATINYNGSDLLYVFSTNTVFEPERGYNKFAAYTLLNYGDLTKESFETAARELGKQGYGTQGGNVFIGSEGQDSDETQPEKRRRLIHADELDSLPPVEWLIQNEIPKRSLTVLFGPSGAGKSFVALDYVLRVAQSAPVVYIAAEGVSGYAARVKAWCRHHKLSAGHLYFLPGSEEMMNMKGVQEFLFEIAEVGPVMVVVDTLARCMVGGDENSAKDMGLFIEGCARLVQATGAAVMPVHHTGMTTSSGPRGSSALYGAADVIIEMINDDGRIQLRCEKSKDSAPFETRRLRLISSDDSCVLIMEKASS
jgi:AAA domain